MFMFAILTSWAFFGGAISHPFCIAPAAFGPVEGVHVQQQPDMSYDPTVVQSYNIMEAIPQYNFGVSPSTAGNKRQYRSPTYPFQYTLSDDPTWGGPLFHSSLMQFPFQHQPMTVGVPEHTQRQLYDPSQYVRPSDSSTPDMRPNENDNKASDFRCELNLPVFNSQQPQLGSETQSDSPTVESSQQDYEQSISRPLGSFPGYDASKSSQLRSSELNSKGRYEDSESSNHETEPLIINAEKPVEAAVNHDGELFPEKEEVGASEKQKVETKQERTA